MEIVNMLSSVAEDVLMQQKFGLTEYSRTITST